MAAQFFNNTTAAAVPNGDVRAMRGRGLPGISHPTVERMVAYRTPDATWELSSMLKEPDRLST
jgi:hypothetical protein